MTPENSEENQDNNEEPVRSFDESDEPLGEKLLDFAMGIGVLTAETLKEALRLLTERGQEAQQNAPQLFDSICARGRPARENLVRTLRSEMQQQPSVESNRAETPLPDDANTDDEIRALEKRMRRLEKEVGAAPAVFAPSSPPEVFAYSAEMAANAPETESEETTAERGTLDFAEVNHSLAGSSYAVSETPEEMARELAETQPGENGAPADVAASTNDVANDAAPTLAEATTDARASAAARADAPGLESVEPAADSTTSTGSTPDGKAAPGA